MELKQEGKQNWRSHLFFGGMSVVMILVVIGIYTSIGQTMIETNINFMKEMAVHDQKILMSSLENQWSILHHVPVAMEQLNPQANQEILSALSIAGDDNAGIIVEVISDKGIAFRSDGTVESDSPDYEAIKNQSGDFALVRGEEQNYLLVGTEIEPLKLGDHVFTYVVSSTPVEEMSSRLRIDSFDGEGICSVIDEKGEFLVDVSQSKEHVKRGNFFRILERAVVKEYNSVDEIKEELVDNPEGVNFRAYLDNQLFIFHMIEVEHALVSDFMGTNVCVITGDKTCICHRNLSVCGNCCGDGWNGKDQNQQCAKGSKEQRGEQGTPSGGFEYGSAGQSCENSFFK